MKGLRSNNTRTTSRSYLSYGLILGVFIILLTYYFASNQFASYSSNVATRTDGIQVMQVPSEDSLQEKKPHEEYVDTKKTFKETEQVVKEQGKFEQVEIDDSKKAILIGHESEKEQENIEKTEQIKQGKSAQVEIDDNKNTILIGHENELEQDKIEKTEQIDLIKNREVSQKRDVIEVEPTEKERKEETEKRDETLIINVTENKEETPKQDVIQVERPRTSETLGEWHTNLEKEKIQEGMNQFNNEERTNKLPHMQLDGVPNLDRQQSLKPLCDQSYGKFDLCDLNGDVRTIGSASVVLLIPPNNGTPTQEYNIKPYSRKYMDNIKPVAVKSLEGPTNVPQCSDRVNYPGLVFAMGGLSGNYWHDFTDILIPLYIRSRQFNREVQFLVTNNQPWWTSKYDKIFKALSRYEIINFDGDNEVRCYPRVLVSYGSYKEFSIDPSRAPNNYTMVDFTKFLRKVYNLEREFPIKLGEIPMKKPRLMIISRYNSRKFINMPDIVQLAEKLGFEVSVIDPKPDNGLVDFARTVNSFDVMLGAHGAGLTNCLFLPPNAVLIQVVPYGRVEHLAKIDFGDPAVDMGLNYLEYSITAEESTLLDTFGQDHEMIRDPLAIHQKDWTLVAEWYLGKQDIKLDLHRFEPVLWQALGLLQ